MQILFIHFDTKYLNGKWSIVVGERKAAGKRKLYASYLALSNLNVDFDLQTDQPREKVSERDTFEKFFEWTCDRRWRSHSHTCSRNGKMIHPSAHETTNRNLFGQIALFYLVIRFNHVFFSLFRSSFAHQLASSSSSTSSATAAEMKISFIVWNGVIYRTNVCTRTIQARENKSHSYHTLSASAVEARKLEKKSSFA